MLKTRKHKIFAGIFTDYLGSIITMAVNIGAIPVFLHFVTIEQYGVWLAINGLIALVTIAEFGGDTYLTMRMADNNIFYSNEGSREIGVMILLKLILGLIFLLIGGTVYLFLPNIIHTSNVNFAVLKMVYMLSLGNLIFGLFATITPAILTARNHLSLVNSSFTVSGLITVGLTLLFLNSGLGILAFPISLLIPSIIQTIVLIIIAKKKYTNLNFKIRGIRASMIQGAFQYIRSFYVIRLVHVFRTNYISILLASLLNPAYVTMFSLTNKMPGLIPGYVAKIALALFPSFSEYHGDGNHERIVDIYYKLAKVIWRIAFFSVIAVYFLNSDFILLWVGKDKFAGVSVLDFLILYMFIGTIAAQLGTIIYSTAQFEKYPIVAFVEMILSMIFSYLLFPSYGFEGIVAGFTLPALITVIYLVSLVHKILKINNWDFIHSILLYASLPNIVTLAVSYPYYKLFGASKSWFELAVFLIIMMVVNFISWEGFRFIFSRETLLKRRLLYAISV